MCLFSQIYVKKEAVQMCWQVCTRAGYIGLIYTRGERGGSFRFPLTRPPEI
jgi:hypothetical protein